MQKSDCIIGVEHVSKFFGDKAVLNDVNLSVRKGEFVTILGPSGCGKTTLLRLIAGFQTASEGVITIAGKDITQTPPHKRPVNTEGNVGGKLKTIARQRKILLERVHENERRIEYLDYLTWQLEHTDA